MPGLHSTPVTIVLPLYKPKSNWKEDFINNVYELNEYLSPSIAVEYIVVHDGLPEPYISEDLSRISEEHKEVKFLYYKKNRGKGYALRQGVKLSTTEHILTIDFDFPYQKESVKEMITLLQQGRDVVVGKRSDKYFQQIPFKRKIISKIFSLIANLFLGLPLRDTQSGIKAFNQKGKTIFLETTINRFLVDTEFILRAWKKNLSMQMIMIEPKPLLSFTNFGFKVIKTESVNFLKLLYLNKILSKTRGV